MSLLEDAERSLLEVAAVFEDGWTIEAAAQVADLDEDRGLELSERLARHSLIYLDSTGPGPRSRMLGTIRAFVAEQLADRPDGAQIHRRHVGYFRALAGQADRPLRGTGQNQWLDQLEAEAGNLAAAVHWHLAEDPSQLPHMFRVLWPFWSLRDHLDQARAWVDQLVPDAAGPPYPGRAVVDGRGDREPGGRCHGGASSQPTAGTAAGAHRRPLPAGLVRAGRRAGLGGGWRPRRRHPARVGLAGRLRGQDEPYWTAAAALSVGSIQAAIGRDDDAVSHLSQARELADRFSYHWLATWSRVQLGTLNALGRPGPEPAG